MENQPPGLAAGSKEGGLRLKVENCIRIADEKLFLDIKAVPGASKSSLGEVQDGRLKVRIAAAPEDGKANEELRSFLAKTLGLRKKDIVLESGEKSRLKTLRLPLSAGDKIEEILLQNTQDTKNANNNLTAKLMNNPAD